MPAIYPLAPFPARRAFAEQAALAANTTHPRVFDYKLEEMETQMGFSYYVQGELQGLMMPAGMKNKFCEVRRSAGGMAWQSSATARRCHLSGRAARVVAGPVASVAPMLLLLLPSLQVAATVWSSGAANVPANAQAYLARTLETAIKEIYALWHAHFVSMAELSSVLEGHDFERLKRPKLFAANHSRCNRTARFKHHLAPTITAVFPTFPGHFPFLVSAVQLAHQYQTLPPTFTVIPSGKLNLTHARRLLDAVMDGNAKAHGVIVIGATHKMDTTETRNAGGNIVHTRLVSWVDSDDQVAPQRFEMLRWVHYLTNSKFMLHHWQPTGAKGFQCGGEWFPGYMFEAKPMVIEHQYGMDGRDLPWVAIAHRHCFTPADFLGVRMQNMLPKYQLNKPAADSLYGSVDGKHHPGYGRAYKYIVKYVPHRALPRPCPQSTHHELLTFKCRARRRGRTPACPGPRPRPGHTTHTKRHGLARRRLARREAPKDSSCGSPMLFPPSCCDVAAVHPRRGCAGV